MDSPVTPGCPRSPTLEPADKIADLMDNDDTALAKSLSMSVSEAPDDDDDDMALAKALSLPVSDFIRGAMQGFMG